MTTTRIVIGQRVHCILYGGMDGIVYRVHGEQTPETVRTLAGGAVAMGGSAHFDIVFEDHVSRMVPESIVRGVQWRVYPDVATAEEIARALHVVEHAEARKKAEAEAAAERRRVERERHAAAHPHLLKKSDRPDWSPGRLAAENIRRELKRAFPGVKFAVRSDFNKVDVGWTDGPTTRAVEAVTSKYKTGDFNGMEDIYEVDPDSTFAQVFGDPKYVFCQREATVEAIRAAWARSGRGKPEDITEKWYERPDYSEIRRVWSDTTFPLVDPPADGPRYVVEHHPELRSSERQWAVVDTRPARGFSRWVDTAATREEAEARAAQLNGSCAR